MLKFIVLPLFLCLTACRVPSPKDNLTSLYSADPASLRTLDKADYATGALPLQYKSTHRDQLKTSDRALFLDPAQKMRSYYKVFSFHPTASEQYIEIHSYPSKGLGFGMLGQIVPVVYLFNDKGRLEPSQFESLYAGYDHSFSDGTFLRLAIKVKGCDTQQNYYVLVAADISRTGTSLRTMPNYGGAAYGIITNEPVQVSPVGAFSILQAENFEAPREHPAKKP